MWFEPFTEKLHEDAEATGDGKIFHLGGKFSTLLVQVQGISGTEEIQFQGSIDGVNYIQVQGHNINSGVDADSTAADGIFSIPIAGLIFFKAPIETRDSGVISVTAVAVAG